MIMKKMYSAVRECTCARARVNSLPRNKRSVGKIEKERERKGEKNTDKIGRGRREWR